MGAKDLMPSELTLTDSETATGARPISIVKLKVLPLLTPGDSTCTVPLYWLMICFTMVRPNPMPSWFISAVRDSLPKREKSFGSSSGCMPFPVSRTEPCNNFVLESYDNSIAIKPDGVNLSAFFTRLIKTCFKRVSSPQSWSSSCFSVSGRGSYNMPSTDF